jgi:heme/copper-type cytochrome/quinol oxidase subunit 2
MQYTKEIIAILVTYIGLLLCNCVYTAAIGKQFTTSQKVEYSSGFSILACLVPTTAIVVLAMYSTPTGGS